MQVGGSAFFLGEFQTGRRALPNSRTLPDRIRLGIRCLFCLSPVMGAGDMLRRCRRCCHRLLFRGKINLRLPAADVCDLARGKVLRHRAVMGHFLRDLFGRFQFVHVASPAFP